MARAIYNPNTGTMRTPRAFDDPSRNLKLEIIQRFMDQKDIEELLERYEQAKIRIKARDFTPNEHIMELVKGFIAGKLTNEDIRQQTGYKTDNAVYSMVARTLRYMQLNGIK